MSTEAAKALDEGATAGMPHTDLATGVPEKNANPRVASPKLPGGDKTSGTASAFDSSGAIGKQFATSGMLGGVGQKIGGPLGEGGMISKQFTDKGSIGGSIQNTLGDHKK
ncbi:Uu.00g105950.m01.CDS01 [Anthostomella pinea]|uniref:Uu.00g105950.m01.CDS01 n=1 Tax=Anthostomella pinea TaxID=933095 RepID=A0AAI8VDX3_9PEZI|nr:Uu.00g105950.m01.CDS01 [Anthostomella pinea]